MSNIAIILLVMVWGTFMVLGGILANHICEDFYKKGEGKQIVVLPRDRESYNETQKLIECDLNIIRRGE